jgi:hypothetical protein
MKTISRSSKPAARLVKPAAPAGIDPAVLASMVAQAVAVALGGKPAAAVPAAAVPAVLAKSVAVTLPKSISLVLDEKHGRRYDAKVAAAGFTFYIRAYPSK